MNRLTSDFLRIISIVFVIIIHSTSTPELQFQKSLSLISLEGLGVLLNQLARFSVPLFILLSGYGFTEKYKKTLFIADSRQAFPYKDFFKSRLDKIFIPFLFWTVFLLFFRSDGFSWNQGTGLLQNLINNTTILGKFLTVRSADYHFYFFVIIIQCYFLYPLLLRLRSKLWILFFLLVQILFTAPAHIWFAELGIPRPRFFSAFFIYWVFYFYAGIYFSWHRELIRKQIRRLHIGFVLLFAAASFFILMFEYFSFAVRQIDPGNYNHFTRQSVILYSAAILMLVLRLEPVLEKLSQKKVNLLANLAGLSFFVYIFHTWILRFLQNFYSQFLFLSFFTTLITFALAFLIYRLPLAAIILTVLGLAPKTVETKK